MHRDKILKKTDKESHIKLLKMHVEFRKDNTKEQDRIFSLTNKVNQFIFNYKRFDKYEIKNYFKDSKKFIFTISLNDKFSDSGNVGVLYFSIQSEQLILDEICISCRALGRNLEDVFIFEPIKYLSKFFKFKYLNINFKNGEKNEPAKQYFLSLYNKISNNKIKKKYSLLIDIEHLNQIYKKNRFISSKIIT